MLMVPYFHVPSRQSDNIYHKTFWHQDLFSYTISLPNHLPSDVCQLFCFFQGLHWTWKNENIHLEISWNIENLYKYHENVMNSSLTPRFGCPSIQFKIIFQKNFQPRLFFNFLSLTMLGNFIWYLLLYTYLYIILTYAMNSLVYEECKEYLIMSNLNSFEISTIISGKGKEKYFKC